MQLNPIYGWISFQMYEIYLSPEHWYALFNDNNKLNDILSKVIRKRRLALLQPWIDNIGQKTDCHILLFPSFWILFP